MKYLSILLLLFTTACMKNDNIPNQPPRPTGPTPTQRPFNNLYIEANPKLSLFDSTNRIFFCEMMNLKRSAISLQGMYLYSDTNPGPYSLQYVTDTLTLTKVVYHTPGYLEFACMNNRIADRTMFQAYWNSDSADYYDPTSDTLQIQFYYGPKDTLTPQQVLTGLNTLLKKKNTKLTKEW